MQAGSLIRSNTFQESSGAGFADPNGCTWIKTRWQSSMSESVSSRQMNTAPG
jgi:hypothetical protein